MFLFSTLLFFVLTPGILLTIPPKSSKTTVAIVHALVFAIIWHFTHKLVWNATEGFALRQPIKKNMSPQNTYYLPPPASPQTTYYLPPPDSPQKYGGIKRPQKPYKR